MTIRMGLRIAALAAVAASMAGAASAAGSVSATAPASVTVIAPIALTKTQDLAFGQVVRPSNAIANTVEIDANNTVTLAGGGNGGIIASPTSSAKFNITAPPGTTYTTTQSLTFTQTGLLAITAGTPVASAGVFGTVPAAGIQEIRLGGSFDMNASTPAQTYTGTLSVTLNYN